MRIFKLYSKLLIMLIALPCADIGVVYANEFVSNQNSLSQRGTSASWLNTLSKDGRSDVISQSEVIRQVKSRYDAEVLRVSLSKDRRYYKVRVLMRNGKVKNIQISAQR